MQTNTQQATQLPVIVSAPTAPQILSHEMNSARWTLKALGVVNLIAGITLLISCWAVYYYAIFLGLMAIMFGGLQVRHTKTESALFVADSFSTPSTLFRKLIFLNIILMVCGGLGILFAAIATERRSLCGDAFCFLVRVDFYFAVFGLLASIAVTVSGIISAYMSRGLEKELMSNFGPQFGQPLPPSASDPSVPQTKYVPLVTEVPRGNPNIVFSEARTYGTTQ